MGGEEGGTGMEGSGQREEARKREGRETFHSVLIIFKHLIDKFAYT